jgi:hypothetical protein
MLVKGKSQKGKNRIKEHGPQWEVIKECRGCFYLKNHPGFLLKAPDGYLRWMAKDNDEDFEAITPKG